jgi:hypothetical protein
MMSSLVLHHFRFRFEACVPGSCQGVCVVVLVSKRPRRGSGDVRDREGLEKISRNRDIVQPFVIKPAAGDERDVRCYSGLLREFDAFR